MKVLCLHEICMVSGAGNVEYQCECPDCPNYVTPAEMERMKEEQRRAEEEKKRQQELEQNCSWKNFAKTTTDFAMGGGVGGVAAGPKGVALGATAGAATGMAYHLLTCWW